jgi:hypothetical protein
MDGGEGGGEEREGRWQGCDHQMQQEQQALGAMGAEWVGHPMEVRDKEMRYQHAQSQRQHQDYHQQQEQQQQSEYARWRDEK